MKYLLAWLLPTVLAVVLIDIGLGFNETATSAPVTPMTICEEPDCETTPPPTTPPPTTPPPTTTMVTTTPPPTTSTTTITTKPPPTTTTTTITKPPPTATVCCVPPPPTRPTHPAPPTGYDAGLSGTEDSAVLGPDASPSFWSIIGFGAGAMLVVAGLASMMIHRRARKVGR